MNDLDLIEPNIFRVGETALTNKLYMVISRIAYQRKAMFCRVTNFVMKRFDESLF